MNRDDDIFKWEELPEEDQEGLLWLFQGWSGKLGNRVFYQRRGITRQRKAPGSTNKIPTPNQAIVRQNLIEGNAFAKNAMKDPQLKVYYESLAIPPQNAFNAAVSDYLKKKTNHSTAAKRCCTACTWFQSNQQL